MAKKPSTELTVQFPEGTAAQRIVSGAVQLPAHLTESIDLVGWLKSVVMHVDYEEPNPDYMAEQMTMLALSATTVAQVLDDNDMPGLQDILDDFPGATTGPIEIDSLYVASSDADMGGGTYVILGFRNTETMEYTRCSTGSAPIQNGLIGMLGMGVWPIPCQIVRIKSKDKGGRYLMKMFPVEG